jgi:hypothetical protein
MDAVQAAFDTLRGFYSANLRQFQYSAGVNKP